MSFLSCRRSVLLMQKVQKMAICSEAKGRVSHYAFWSCSQLGQARVAQKFSCPLFPHTYQNNFTVTILADW